MSRSSTNGCSECCMADRYGTDVLSEDWRKPARGHSVEVAAERGMVVEDATTGFVGEIMLIERDPGMVVPEDRRLTRRAFPFGPGFLLDGEPVILRPQAAKGATTPTRTASGSRAVTDARARV